MYVIVDNQLHSIQTQNALHGIINIHMQIYKSASVTSRGPEEGTVGGPPGRSGAPRVRGPEDTSTLTRIQ